MSRVRILSNTQALFVGPAPSSGYHFLTHNGVPTGITSFSIVSGDAVFPNGAHNAIKQINGLSELSYGIATDRSDIKELGRKSNIDRAHINHPEINLDFSYYGLDLRNEIRLGFNVNFPTGVNLTPFFSENLKVPLISGFTTRATGSAYPNQSVWPHRDRDKRNFFVSIGPEGVDAKNDTGYLNSHVVGFGDCYIKSYSVNFQVGQIITHDLSYSAENIVFYLSGSGQIPAANPINLQPVNNNRFVMPQFETELISKDLLKSQDVTFDILSTGYGSSPEDARDLGLNIADLKVQSAKITLNFNRQNLKGLGYKNHVDRVIINPTLATLSVEAIVGQDQEGTLRDLLIKDHDYNLTIKVQKAQDNCTLQAIDFTTRVSYDFLKAKFNSIQYGNVLNEGKTVNLDFTAELTDDVTGRGLYMSGRVFRTGQLFSGFNF